MQGIRRLVFAATLLFASVALAGAPIDETVPAESGSEIRIENLAGSVTVMPGSDREVHVGGTLGDNAKGVSVETDDQDVNIKVILPQRVEDIAGTDLVVRVPPRAELSIETVSANVSVDGVEGQIAVETVSGSIGIQVAEHGERIRLETVSGPMEIRGGTRDVRAESVSGKIVIAGSTGEVEANTTSGAIEVSGREFRGIEIGSVSGPITLEGDPVSNAEYELENLNGSITLRLSEGADAEIRVETFTGDIDSDFEGSVVGENGAPGDWLRTVVGSGAASVKISTFSGPVRIEKR